MRLCVSIALALGIAITPIAHAQDYYLARAIGEPVPSPAAREPKLPRNVAPDLPGLGTDAARSAEVGQHTSSSTWKWVVGIAVTAAVIALAKGGGSGGGGSDAAPSSGGGGGGGSGGTSGGSGGGSGNGRGGGPSLPGLPGFDDDD